MAMKRRNKRRGPECYYPSFREFLKYQDAEYQNMILGEEKADLFREGKLIKLPRGLEDVKEGTFQRINC